MIILRITFFVCFCSAAKTQIRIQEPLFTVNHKVPHNPVNPLLRNSIASSGLEQKLDHFDPNNTAKWINRYVSNFVNFTDHKPIYIHLVGEGNVDNFLGYLYSGLMYEIATQTGGMLVLLEHRYYGGSNNDMTTMKYLTVEQTLADVANFITVLKQDPQLSQSKVAVFGGSYPGVLAARMRQTHPSLVQAAVSSSAPLKSVVDFSEYLEAVQNSIHSDSCVTSLRKALAVVKNYTGTTSQLAKLKKDFRMCEEINSTNPDLDASTLFQQLEVIISNWIQYGTSNSISQFCTALMTPPALDDYARLVNLITSYLNANYKANSCIPSYTDIVEGLKSNAPSDNRAWIYQQCSQLGDLISTDSSNQPFQSTVPISWWFQLCNDVFSVSDTQTRLQKAVDELNKKYGGNTITSSFTNIVTTHGSLDPWSTLGLTSSSSPTAPVIIINGVSHCADLSPASSTDPESLTEARESIKQYIQEWVA